MPLGDSLTVGTGVPGGYRKRLFYVLRDQGYDVDFIGSSTENSVSQLLDNDHEGHASWSCEKLMEFSQEIFDNVDDPDVILLLIGSQDMKATVPGQYDRPIQCWDDLISHISNIRPYTHIIASNLMHENNQDFDALVDKYFNVYVETIVQKHKDNGRKVSFVNNRDAVDANYFDSKGSLSKRGFKLLGEMFAKAVQNVIPHPEGDDYAPRMIRAEGSMDKTQVTITFSKPLSDTSANVNNFRIHQGVNEPVEIIHATLDDEKRKITLTASSKQYHDGKTYIVTIVDKVVDRTKNNDGVGLNAPLNSVVKFHAGFRFIVLSDWHSAEKYVKRNPGAQAEMDQDIKVVKYLSNNYGGDFVLIPGDTNAGQWHKPQLRKTLGDLLHGEPLTPQQTVLEAGKRCYGGMLNAFRLGGYANVLLSHGDHEAGKLVNCELVVILELKFEEKTRICVLCANDSRLQYNNSGDNPWKVNSLKSKLQPEFRKALGDNFNLDYDGQPRYNGTIGDAPARPSGSFSDTVYAYLHKNILVVTVDPFFQEAPNKQISDAGTVAMRIVGEQLNWLDSVLSEGRKHPQVKHIFVQAHVPVLHPVKKSRSSGQMMEMEEKSDFWKTLQKHEVDIYFTGEVSIFGVSSAEVVVQFTKCNVINNLTMLSFRFI